jgi:hypothetical protein
MNDAQMLGIEIQPGIIIEVDLFIESIFPDSVRVGQLLAEKKMKKTQVRGLENLAHSTRRFSEIINYIKNQAGKEQEKEKKWSETAPIMLKQLEVIGNKAAELAGANTALLLDLKLRMARGWMKQVVAAYLYHEREIGR